MILINDTLKNSGDKEARKAGAEFPPDPLSARLHFGAGSWKRAKEMIFPFCSATMVAGWNH